MFNIPPKIKARIVGLLILIAYAILGSGNPNQKILGMSLEVISGVAVIGIPVLMFPLLKPFGLLTSRIYMVLRVLEGTVMIVAGLLFLSNNERLLAIRDILYSYHGYVFAVAALFFYYLLYVSKLVPRWISVWGVGASLLVVVVNLLDFVGINSGLMILFLPIIANEIVLSGWLLIKGFNLNYISHKTFNRK